ncbi:MAG: RNA pseudouridine synthase [Candidatus Colwellbacteria bacterium]|nr:RNA pseudouridine synthase [Candidatus Colwellbacteria bacterium]
MEKSIMMERPIEVLYEDNHLIAVKKPAGELVQGDASGEPSLMDRVKIFIKERDKKPGNVFLGLVHRLDRPVSGIVLFAKTSKGASRISEQFRERKTKKTYRALIEGEITPLSGTLRTNLIKDGSRRTAEISKDGKEAVLDYRTIEKGKRISLIEIDLGTGRFHQIRAQLSEAGHPIVGDIKYGAKIFLPNGIIALSAIGLEFEKATGSEKTSVKIPEPAEWKKMIS